MNDKPHLQKQPLADIRLSALTPATLSKSDFNTELILRNLSEQLFYRTPLMTAYAFKKLSVSCLTPESTLKKTLKRR